MFRLHPSQGKLMSQKRILNIVTSRPDANNPDKKHWQQHGILILGINNLGEERISIKLNSLPIATEFDGWFSVFPREDEPSPGARSRHHSSMNNNDDNGDWDDLQFE